MLLQFYNFLCLNLKIAKKKKEKRVRSKIIQRTLLDILERQLSVLRNYFEKSFRRFVRI